MREVYKDGIPGVDLYIRRHAAEPGCGNVWLLGFESGDHSGQSSIVNTDTYHNTD